jgi:hypothetical protein
VPEKMLVQEVQKFPNDHAFQQILLAARGFRGTLIHDADGFQADYTRFLNDILELRKALQENLPPTFFDEQGLLHENNSYIYVFWRLVTNLSSPILQFSL